MSEDLTMHMERRPEQGVLLLHVAGQLTVRSRHTLRRAILKALVECPDAVIVDLSETRLVDRLAATMFVAARRDADVIGPGITLLWYGASGLLVDRLRALDRHQPPYESLYEALDALSAGPMTERWLYRRLEPVAASANAAGALIADTCRAWDVPDLVRPTRRAVFELTRAMLWCPPKELQLTAVRRQSRLVVSVRGLIAGAHADWCRPRRQLALGYPIRRTPTGHFGWTSFQVTTTDPREQLAA
jgi:hypothetical protein